MQSLFSKLTKFILCGALLSALAFTFGHTASAAPSGSQTLYIVNSSSDGNTFNNTLSLREAILLANHGTGGQGLARVMTDKEKAQVSGDCVWGGSTDAWYLQSGCGAGNPGKINFNIPNCPCTIALDTVLPAITDQLVVDGYSEPGASQNTSKGRFNGVVLVKLDGSALDFAENGLTLSANSSNIYGLEILNFKAPGIKLNGNFDILGGNLIHNNLQGGIIVSGNHDTIGGSLGLRNVIYANGANGIELDVNANNTYITYNFIGTPPEGKDAKGNGFSGIAISSSNNFIGKNRIAYNHQLGVYIGEANKYVTGNHLTQNTIFTNLILGIDLAGDGVTYNDIGTPADPDTGVNNLQNFPYIKKASSDTKTVNIDFRSTANTKFRLEFFASRTCDPSGFGQGQKYIGGTEVTTPANGIVQTSVGVKKFKKGWFITATATDPGNNTSEFAKCRKAK